MVVLGLGLLLINSGASTFFVFAAAFVPFAVQTERAALGLIAVIVALAGLETWAFHLPGWFFFLRGRAGFGSRNRNIYFAQRNRGMAKLRRANEEIEHLAKVAERERIARDLHDVLGHTVYEFAHVGLVLNEKRERPEWPRALPGLRRNSWSPFQSAPVPAANPRRGRSRAVSPRSARTGRPVALGLPDGGASLMIPRIGKGTTAGCPCARAGRTRPQWPQSPGPRRNSGPCAPGDRKFRADSRGRFPRWPKPRPG